MLLISFEFGGYLANTFKVSYHSIFNANFKLHAVIGKNYSRTPIKQGNGLWPLKSGQSPFPREKKRGKKRGGRLHEGPNNKNAIIGTLITGRLIEVAV